MSILTKVFVVLVTLMAVALVATTVSFVARTENDRSKLQNVQVQLRQAEAKAKLLTGELLAINERASATKAEISAENANLRSEIATLDTENKRLVVINRDLAARQGEFEGRLAQLVADGTRNQTILEGVLAELNDRRERMLELQKRDVRNLDTINQLQSNNDALTKQLRLRREQTVALEEHVTKLEEQWSRVPVEVQRDILNVGKDDAGSDSTFVPGFTIVGEVTDVAQSDGVTLVQVNIGSNDRVEENMRFMVHRGETYLGEMVIVKVDKNASAGRLRRADSGAQIVVSDSVRTGPLF